MRGRVPAIRGLLAISTPDENVAFDCLIPAFEDDGIVFVFLPVDNEFIIVWITEIGLLGRFDIVLPVQ